MSHLAGAEFQQGQNVYSKEAIKMYIYYIIFIYILLITKLNQQKNQKQDDQQ